MKTRSLSGSRIRVGVVEQQNLLREGLVALLQCAEGYDCVGAWPEERQLLENACSVKPEVLVVGISSEIPTMSPSLLHFARSAPEMQIIAMVTGPKNCSCDFMSDTSADTVRSSCGDTKEPDASTCDLCSCIAKDFPARAVIAKTSSFASLSRVIREVYQSQDFRKPNPLAPDSRPAGGAAPRDMFKEDGLSLLSDRERQVTLLVAQGLANKAISLELGVSYSTVKNHVSRILEKLGLDHRTQLALYAVSMGGTYGAGVDCDN